MGIETDGVWVVQEHYDYEGETLLGVCATREDAVEFVRSKMDSGRLESTRDTEWSIRFGTSSRLEFWVDYVRLYRSVKP